MTAFKAVYSDFKLVKTRGVIQVILEVPIEQSDAAYEVLGGMPQPSKERWFAVAALAPGAADAKPNPEVQPRPDRAKRDWRDLPASQQAALRCNDATFRAFLNETQCEGWAANDGLAAECIRSICRVASRAELDTNHKARVIWHQLDSQYQAWVAKERVGA
ncbi:MULTISPECIES: hypothetical protein [unclassified Bradyrhizobium]|uniref:hypothetical protein n=1 Tax=unclassified Bradyrhizobium TaxID=2631580 RepID=UPI0028E641B3|nr:MULTISPECIES: hypothetical protein [unclassified Bradyrhizobium]